MRCKGFVGASPVLKSYILYSTFENFLQLANQVEYFKVWNHSFTHDLMEKVK